MTEIREVYKFYDVSNHMIRDALIQNQNIYDNIYYTILFQTAKYGHFRWIFIFFQNLMTLMFQIWKIWDEEARSIGVT